MKRELFWLGGIGLGAGFMYWFDPAHGRQRRARTRAQLLSARHRAEDLMSDATPDLHNLHLPQPYRAPRMSPFRRQRQHRGLDAILLALGGLGLSAALTCIARSRHTISHSGEPASGTTLQSVYDWACGVWDGVCTWFRPEVEAPNAANRPYEREHEVTMMGVEAESTKAVESR